MADRKYTCPRCAEDPHPYAFASPRKCAFSRSGRFVHDNWNCATIDALLENAPRKDILGHDETCSVIVCPEDYPDGEPFGGFLVLTRYKRRGQTACAIWVGTDGVSKELTLPMVEVILAWAAHVKEVTRAQR